MKDRGDIYGLWIAMTLAWFAGPCTAYGEPVPVKAQVELAEVARGAIADDFYHYCTYTGPPEYHEGWSEKLWREYCQQEGEAKANALSDAEAIREFESMLQLWAEGAEQRK